MIPIGAEATAAVLSWGDGLHRTLALRHAVLRGRPGLWGDHPVSPSSVVWLRDGGTRFEAFAAGFADPALAWLEQATAGRSVVLAAPAQWEVAVRARWEPGVRVECSTVQTWFRPKSGETAGSPVAVRLLNRDDRSAFEALAPDWAVRSWGTYTAMLTRGLAVGVPMRSGGSLAAVAWIVEADRYLAKVGVATAPRLRRLGLGRAVASDLLARIEAAGRWEPLWVANPSNIASTTLARSLGFAAPVSEPLFWWNPA